MEHYTNHRISLASIIVMHSILLRDHSSLCNNLLLQKERLQAELKKATYQAFVDKGVIQGGLDDLREMKELVQGEMVVLSDALALKISKSQRVELERTRAVDELSLIEVQKEREEDRMASTLASNIRQHDDNQTLSSTLKRLNIDVNKLEDSKRKFMEEFALVKKRVEIAVNNIHAARMKNTESSLNIRDIEGQNKLSKERNVSLSFGTEQASLTTCMMKQDTQKLKKYSSKLKQSTEIIQEETEKALKEVENVHRRHSLVEKEINLMQLDFEGRVAGNRKILLQNQSLTAQNYNFYQQNNVTVLDQSNYKKVIVHLSQTNVRLNSYLNEKEIVNLHTQLVLGMPLKSSSSKITLSKSPSTVTSKIAPNENVKDSMESTSGSFI